MSKNPILDELHATRRKLLEESGGTLAGLVARLQAEQQASDRPILKTQRTNKALTARSDDRSGAEVQSLCSRSPED